ncbi:SGNH hydrolase domain-containing protein [Aliarcobacter cryaerophilus]|uniref:SGNH hydrolase domain-containing protein n=1 Tax=Aliarcobacter cryaerophilus TaxID=28198 RepID=UPI003DA58157
MILISYLSYRFFENPIRRSKNNKKYLILLFFVLFIIAFYKGAKYTNGYEFRQSQEVREALKHFEKAEYTRLIHEKSGLQIISYLRKDKETLNCDSRVPSTSCKIEANGKSVLLAGDSFAGTFGYILSEQKNLNINFFTHQQCPFVSEGIWFGTRPECSDINKLRLVEIEKMKPTNILIVTNFGLFNGGKKMIEDYVVWGTKTNQNISKQVVYESFRKNIERLIQLGHNPIIMLQPPNPIKDGKSYDVAKELKRQVASGVLSFKEEWDAKPTTNIDNEVRNALKGLNVTFIDMNAKMCKENKCLTFNKNGGLFNGGQHLSYFGAQLFVDDIIKVLK